MKRRIATLLIAAAVTIGTVLPAAAAVDEMVTGEGYVGLDDSGGTVDPDDYVELTMPTDFEWTINETNNRAVDAPTYTITNDSTVGARLNVTLKEFKQTNRSTVTIPAGALTLNFTDDLLEGTIGKDLQNDYTGTTAYTNTLDAGDDFEFSFSGGYTGVIPVTPLVPEYTMTLAFELDSLQP